MSNNKQSVQILNLFAYILAFKFINILEQIDKSHKEGYFIYDGIIFFGNRFGVFFVSNQNEWK